MSMFTLTGQVIHTFKQQGRVDESTGQKSPDVEKVQLLGEIPVPAGGHRVDLVTLTVPDGVQFTQFKDKRVSVPLGMFSPSKGNIIYYIPKGSKVQSLPPVLSS